LANAGNQDHIQLRIGVRKLTGRIRLTWETMADTSKGEFAYRQSKRSEIEGLINDLARRDEHALSTEGRGVLALVDEADPDGDTTLELDAPFGITNDNFGNRGISVGMFLGFVNPATGGLRASTTKAKVTAVNADGTDVTVDAAANIGTAVADSDYVVQIADSASTSIVDTSFEKAWWGLMGLVDDGTYREDYFNVPRASYDAYKAYVLGSAGALSIDQLQRVADVASQKMNGVFSLALAHHSTRRVYLQLLEADRRYAGQDLRKPDGATVAFKQGDITIGEVPIKALRDFPLDVLMFLDVEGSDFVSYVSEKGKWADEDGSVLKQVGTGTSLRDSYEAYYRIRKQNFCRFPGKNARLDGITGQTLVVVRPAGQ